MKITLSEFYEAILPEDGKYCLATKENYFKHVVCEDKASLQQQTIKAVKAGLDVYMALGSFKQGFHDNAKGKKVVRVRDNVHKLKALWFDIDFKGGLSNPTEVVAALREFCNRTRMPAPSILVHSGNGVHVYWPLQIGIAYSRWQVLADALKSAASSHGLPADLVCTADAARVLRPIGSRNYKDKGNPKPVLPIFWNGKLFNPDELEVALLGSGSTNGGCADGSLHIDGPVPEYVRQLGANDDLDNIGNAPKNVQSFIANVARKCLVLGHILTTNGEDCSEPEWTASLQLAKHCADGELYYHDLSSGHRDYQADATTQKWQQRLENTAGPTLCDTFALYRPELCKACPHRGSIKTPLSLGEEEVVTSEGKEFPLSSWRPVEGDMGMERKMFDPGTKQYMWEKVLRRSWEITDASCDILSGAYTLSMVTRLGNSKPISVDIPSRLLGDHFTLKKELADKGCGLLQSEVQHWTNLMTTWLEQIQQKRRVTKSVARLGWIEERNDDNNVNITGFTAGDTSYMSDGDMHTGLRIAADYREVARHYLPQGDIEEWRSAANFIADQDIPAFTATLASSFAAPLFGFTGMPGCMMTLVSKESGLGKSSVLKTAQAVWGSPTRGLNSTSDTANSIVRKVAFLKNLPVYWDEIRGEKSLAAFYSIAFDIAQGKEKTRLNSNADMREVNDWKTILIGASNESIFDYMAQLGGASNAATARTFEVEIEPFDDPTRATRNAMFGTLDSNYGHAGQIYSKYIATRAKPIAQTVRKAYESLYDEWGLREGERFWCATAAALLVGAGLAKKSGLVNINTKTLKHYLHNRILILRQQSNSALINASARELVIAYIQRYKPDTLVIDQYPKPGISTDPQILAMPKSGQLKIVQVSDTYRFTSHDFTKWLFESHGVRWSTVEKEMKEDLACRKLQAALGAKTPYSLPRVRVFEVTL